MKERTIPKTTSGKIQRRRARTLLQNGGLDIVRELAKHPPSAKSTSEEVPLRPTTSKPRGPADANDFQSSGPPTPEVEVTKKSVQIRGLRPLNNPLTPHPVVCEWVERLLITNSSFSVPRRYFSPFCLVEYMSRRGVKACQQPLSRGWQ